MSTVTTDVLYDNYMQDIVRYPRITSEREAELSAIIRHGNDEDAADAAVNELVEANLLLVVHCMKEFLKFLDSPGARLTHMDLISEGNIGLVRAARNYNANCTSTSITSNHARFSTYACKSIKNAMRRAIKLSRFIHIPEHHFRYWTRMRELEETYGEELSDSVLQRNLEVGNAKLQMLKQSQETGTCLLEDLTANEDNGTWSDFIADEQASTPLDEVEGHDLYDFLDSELAYLPERTQAMLRATFLSESPCTYAQLSREHGVSKERCRQVCAQGLAKLRERMEHKRASVTGILQPVETTIPRMPPMPDNLVRLKQIPTKLHTASTAVAEEDAA
ncbi:MAG: sigma-70 family RNA polymerase sigma factor [Kiritimatiellae bacterium]|nr:sigma-70 family RNA polymerase sigma factor [Kiritimatiellia bacterium]